MTDIPVVELSIFSDDCDAFGHLNQARFLALFERARWEALARGPGVDLFSRNGAWPAVRHTVIDYLLPAVPGDRLRFELELTQLGRTSLTLRQVARNAANGGVVAETESVFVCVGSDGQPVQVPSEVSRFFGVRGSRRSGATQQLSIQGRAVAVDVTGEGPAVLFVHGFPLDRTMWRPVTAMLTGWQRIAPDLRGLGLSEGPGDGYSIGEYAEDLVALLDVLQVERAVVCGLSMGGYVAFELLRCHAARVSGLILMNTRASPDDADGRARRDAAIARVQRDGAAFLVEDMVPKLLAPTSIQTMPEVVRHTRAMVGAAPAAGVIGALAAMRDRRDATPLLPGITVPTLVVAGSDDQLIPLPVARAMAGAIPGAQFAAIPGAGHLAPIEQPVNTGRVVREFLEALS